MARIRHFISAAAGLALLALPARNLEAQILSGPGAPAQVALSAAKVEFLTLTLSAATLTNTDLATSNVLGSLTASMDWTLSPSRGNVYLVGWFGTTTAMTDGGGNDIAAADVFGACTASSMTGSACSPSAAFTETANTVVGSTAATRTLWTSAAITGTTRNQTGVTAALQFSIAPAAVAALPAGTYTGTLNLRAYAQ